MLTQQTEFSPWVCEEEFGIHISNCEVTQENFGSLRAVARFVASKQPFAVG